MNGGIKLDVGHLSLKEVNAIIIAVENHHYSVLPKVGASGEFEYFLQPTGIDTRMKEESDINLLLCKLAPGQFGNCNNQKQTEKSFN